MQSILEKIIARASSWPKEDQEELARIALEIERVRGGSTYTLSDEERAAVKEGLAQAERREFVSDAEMEAFLRSCRA